MDSDSGELAFGEEAISSLSGVRTVGDLSSVLRTPVEVDPRTVAYHLYRNVARKADEQELSRANLKYDLTVTLPGLFGAEFPKTTGHYHPSPGGGASFPEIYEVAYGRAAFLLQRADDPSATSPEIQAVWIQICSAGQKIVIPGECGHVTVNIGPTPLVVADLVSSHSGHLYGSFQTRQGASYYLLADSNAAHGFRLEKNPAYRQLPSPAVAAGPRCFPWLEGGPPIYTRASGKAVQFSFLDSPSLLDREVADLWAPSRIASQ
jgi:oxalate decarboxylase/phosphoglucose isomerase-like protein (cupin superfamily)